MEKRYDPVINNCLTVFAKKSEWLLMRTYLCNLSNSGFRTASYVLAEHVLTTLENDAFWQCFATIAQPDTKVYLKTFLKAAVLNYKRGAQNVLLLLAHAVAVSVRPGFCCAVWHEQPRSNLKK